MAHHRAKIDKAMMVSRVRRLVPGVCHLIEADAVQGCFIFNSGREVIESRYTFELREIERIIAAVDSKRHKTKRKAKGEAQPNTASSRRRSASRRG
jgi:hypothetical protein